MEGIVATRRGGSMGESSARDGEVTSLTEASRGTHSVVAIVFTVESLTVMGRCSLEKVGEEIKSKEIGVIKEGLVSEKGCTSVKGSESKGSRFWGRTWDWKGNMDS